MNYQRTTMQNFSACQKWKETFNTNNVVLQKHKTCTYLCLDKEWAAALLVLPLLLLKSWFLW